MKPSMGPFSPAYFSRAISQKIYYRLAALVNVIPFSPVWEELQLWWWSKSPGPSQPTGGRAFRKMEMHKQTMPLVFFLFKVFFFLFSCFLSLLDVFICLKRLSGCFIMFFLFVYFLFIQLRTQNYFLFFSFYSL